MHIFAQLQFCIYSLNILNGVLLNPYENCVITKFYNGTFLYNFTHNLSKNKCITVYTEKVLSKTPTLYYVYKSVCKFLEIWPPINIISGKPKKKRKKKRKSIKATNLSEDEEEITDNDITSEFFNDENNKFSKLSLG